MEYKTLITELEDGVLTCTLNRPDQLNAIDEVMWLELLSFLDAVDQNDDVRVLVFTGAGRGFCAGADLGRGEKAFDHADEVAAHEHRDGGGLIALRLFELKKPVIAAINGAAVGVGITSMLAADVRIATPKAKFGFVFARRGIVPDACSSWFLPRVVGISRAMEWLATGRLFGADEALEGGLVSRLVPPDELLPTAHGLAREIADNTGAVSVALARQLCWKMLGADHPMEAHKLDSRFVYAMGQSPDGHEGVQSFLDRRPPRFTMKVSADMPEPFPWWKERFFED